MPSSSLVHRASALAALTALTLATCAASAQTAEPPAHPRAPATAYSPPPAAIVVVAPPGSHHWLGDEGYRSPGIAAALSLTPIPVDFGNFYAENVGWGIAHTTGQVLLMGGMMWIGADHMCHRGAPDCGDWSVSERNAMIGLAGAYIAVKIVAAFQASDAARELNARYRAPAWSPVVVPASNGAALGIVATF